MCPNSRKKWLIAHFFGRARSYFSLVKIEISWTILFRLICSVTWRENNWTALYMGKNCWHHRQYRCRWSSSMSSMMNLNRCCETVQEKISEYVKMWWEHSITLLAEPCVTLFGYTTLWCHLWSITIQTHSNIV